jgi:hypothetical protein
VDAKILSTVAASVTFLLLSLQRYLTRANFLAMLLGSAEGAACCAYFAPFAFFAVNFSFLLSFFVAAQRRYVLCGYFFSADFAAG